MFSKLFRGLLVVALATLATLLLSPVIAHASDARPDVHREFGRNARLNPGFVDWYSAGMNNDLAACGPFVPSTEAVVWNLYTELPESAADVAIRKAHVRFRGKHDVQIEVERSGNRVDVFARVSVLENASPNRERKGAHTAIRSATLRLKKRVLPTDGSVALQLGNVCYQGLGPVAEINIRLQALTCDSYANIRGNQITDESAPWDATAGGYEEWRKIYEDDAPKVRVRRRPGRGCSFQQGQQFAIGTTAWMENYAIVPGVTDGDDGILQTSSRDLPVVHQQALFWVHDNLWFQWVENHDFGAIQCYKDSLHADDVEWINFDNINRLPANINCVAWNVAVQNEDDLETGTPEVEQPEVEEPEIEEPQVEQPDSDQPENEQPQIEEPQVEQPDSDQPENEQPEIEEPQVDQPENEQPEVEEPQVDQPDADQPETPGADQPENEQPENDQPDTDQPDVDQPETPPTDQPDVDQPETPGAQEPEAVAPDLPCVLQLPTLADLQERIAATPELAEVAQELLAIAELEDLHVRLMELPHLPPLPCLDILLSLLPKVPDLVLPPWLGDGGVVAPPATPTAPPAPTAPDSDAPMEPVVADGPVDSRPANAVFCANEWSRCELPDTATIYYGADGSYIKLSRLSGSISCKNSVFTDPLTGTVKACYYVVGDPEPEPASSGQAHYCAAERSTCVLPGPATVYYGAGERFVELSDRVGSVPCNNSTFTDPAYGITKACYYVLTDG